MGEKDCGQCEKCGSDLRVVWDEDGFGYSAKVWICEKCGWVARVEYLEDHGLDVNNDPRWYEYEYE